MKFLCDVHIPFSLVNHLKSLGFDVIHVNELPEKWFSTDKFISELADNNDRIVITKDSDFKNSFFIHHTPAKLIKVNLGNISNTTLIQHISDNLSQIEELNKLPYFIIEIDYDNTHYSTLNRKL